jgi:hypothetical protein
MCWFSKNERISTRKAIEGEELVVQDFPYRRWVASPQNPQKAVCLSNGCKLRLNEIPERLQKLLGVGPEAVAEFRELHRPPRTSLFAWLLPPLSLYDVLVFPDGNYLEISELPLGLQIDVLSEAVLTSVNDEKKHKEPQLTHASRRQSGLTTSTEVVRVH